MGDGYVAEARSGDPVQGVSGTRYFMVGRIRSVFQDPIPPKKDPVRYANLKKDQKLAA